MLHMVSERMHCCCIAGNMGGIAPTNEEERIVIKRMTFRGLGRRNGARVQPYLYVMNVCSTAYKQPPPNVKNAPKRCMDITSFS